MQLTFVILISSHHFQKQTYRNRCYIYAANGRLLLNIPIIHNKKERNQKTKDIRIENSFPWQKLHFKSTKTTVAKKKYTKPTTSTKKVTTTTSSSNKRLTWRWPTSGKILSTYSKSAAGRKGIDIAGKSGQSIIAAASGKVVYSGNGLPRYGNLLIIKHNDVYLSAYAHNKTLLVKEGQLVKAGQKIALLGRSGTQQNQLHFEIRRNGKPVDPMRFLPKR